MRTRSADFFSFNKEILCQITTADSRWKHYSIISCFIDRIRYQPASIFIISKAFKKPLSNLSEFLTETSCIMLAASLILRCRKTDEHLRVEFWKMPLCISSRLMLICFTLFVFPRLNRYFSYALKLPLTHLGLLKFENDIQRNSDVINFFSKTYLTRSSKMQTHKTTTTFESRAYWKSKSVINFHQSFHSHFLCWNPFHKFAIRWINYVM